MSKTESSRPSSHGTTKKRPNDTDEGGGYARGTMKKPKLAPPPVQLGMCKCLRMLRLCWALMTVW